MRKYLAFVMAPALLLFTVGMMAQTSHTKSSQATTTTTTTTKSTVSGPERNLEGCLVKEASDFFLIPRLGNPIALQPGNEDLSAQEGHKVRVRGIESSLNGAAGPGAVSTGGTASAVANTPSGKIESKASTSAPSGVSSNVGSSAAGTSGVATGTGDDLHRLAKVQMTVTNLTSVADTCPMNWNSRISRPPAR